MRERERKRERFAIFVLGGERCFLWKGDDVAAAMFGAGLRRKAAMFGNERERERVVADRCTCRRRHLCFGQLGQKGGK